MNVDDMIPPKPSEFLKPAMIGFERELCLTIDRVDSREFQFPGKAAETGYIVYWREGILGKAHPHSIALKGLKLNKTQIKALGKYFGKETTGWVGKRVKMGVDIGEMNGESYETIKVFVAKTNETPNPWHIDELGKAINDEYRAPSEPPTGGPTPAAVTADEMAMSGGEGDDLPF